MIVKVQTSLWSTEPVQRFLLYNKERSLVLEGDVGDVVKLKLYGRYKAYFEARVTDDGLELGEEVAAQDW